MASTGEADRGHPGGVGVDTCRAVLDDETAVRRRRKLLCGIRERETQAEIRRSTEYPVEALMSAATPYLLRFLVGVW
jgi:hypothetical protein